MGYIEIDRISKTYTGKEEVHALREMSLDIGQGEFTAVMGPSGSGKSTLLSILGGLQHPTDGRLIVDGIDVYALPGDRRADFRREYVGFVFQSFQLIPYLSVLENAMLPLATTRFSRSKRESMAHATLEKVGLEGRGNRLPDELSGGEQQRAAIARALVNQPPIVLADEPTGNLDTSTSEGVMKLLQSLHSEGETIVIVTHNPENLRFIQRCIRLRDGKIEGKHNE